MTTVHVIVSGKVQGVFFRDYTRRRAMELGLSGWVRNLSDGSVEVLVDGRKKDVDAMISWFQDGSPLSLVTSVIADEIFPTEKYKGFTIRY